MRAVRIYFLVGSIFEQFRYERVVRNCESALRNLIKEGGNKL